MHNKGKGRRAAGVVLVSAGVGAKAYTPAKLLTSRELHIKAIMVSVEATNAILPSYLCNNPMPPW